ncbi:MAG: pseudaminic acid synthase [Bacteroidales bacterium]|nr:pseudaminic acid synthase [Bacteroidales bacterium]
MKGAFIIAELSANHNNDFELAKKTITAIKESRADAVKVQTYKPESLTLNIDTGYFVPKTDGLWKGYTPWELFKEASMPYEWQPKLKKYAEELGLIFFSSPFDLEAVDFLEKIDNPIYKIASPEITDVNLIGYAASKGKPMIISTGLADIKDIELALEACRKVGNNDVTLLKCTSQYPASIVQANLRTMIDMKKRFGVKVGLSDHTMGSLVPTVAVSLGAEIVEKHFVLDRSLGGPDSAFSMEPNEFKEMVDTIRNVEKSLGEVTYKVSEEDNNRRRSLFAVKDIKAGETLTEDNVRSIRPGIGLHPKFYNEVVGRITDKDYRKGEPLSHNLIK